MPDVLERLHHLPDHTIVLYCCFTQDAQGNRFIAGSEALSMVAGAANAPVFVNLDSHINYGVAGGVVSSFVQQGRIAGELALRILKGEKPQDMPKVSAGTISMFDWRALKRWGFKESNLPPDSIVVNRQPTTWESYKRYIIGGVSLILVEALLIFGLTWHRKRLKNTETELRKSQERLAGIVGSAMDAIITIDEEQRIVLFNTAAEKMFACSQDKAIGSSINQYIRHGVHTENGAEMSRFYDADVTSSVMGELQAVRANSQEFPIEASISRAESGGKRLFTVIIRDITERRQAEEALATVGRRLIEAHEEERTWIGRELHDDINQRLALVAVEIDRWNQQVPGNTQLRDQVQHTKQHITEIAKDVQGLSHRLHSSKLEYLGLAAAANSFCRELSEQQNVKIEFSHADVPRSLSREISLCLFRVLQEALQNAVKHSGANDFSVELHGTSQAIQLTVSDIGAGFDQQAAVHARGLGLISMRERLQLVNGELLIKSEPTRGTTIRARVPLIEGPNVNSLAG
jgi:PAS domain S-box-containing protein